MKRKFIALTLTAGMLVSMTACGGNSDNAAEDTNTAGTEETTDDSAQEDATDDAAAQEDASSGESGSAAEVETVTDGVLTVATSPDFAPYEFYAIGEDGTPQLAGFDIALAQYIADYMGLELEIIPVDFDGVISELQTKSVDLGMAGLSPDPDRESVMDFSDIYYTGGQSLVTTKENADKYNSFEAINNPDVTVGAQTASIQLDLAQTNSPDADIISLPKVTDIIAELVAGTMDAAYIETVVAESYQANYPDLEIVMDVPYDQEGSAIGVCKDNEGLLAAVNEAIAAAIEDGSMDQFVAEANELASGQTYEGLLDEEGNVQE
ncbi:MAG: transporter substrate-binding domain-containing protein [Clostridiales bacterium]|uniref:Transporter substrate-binding domain-containing protein n=1 Tax=Candidatus Pullilachnospira stercoravium TaxID=2840913 RepID=A0A9D1NW51_9FIRM|nr:transporter substrate-binding domain-containing protein [Clostridiales bacterium]HIV13657.1 transporter substrate-binding domain-containing protein [Candidatus Pullilachnospira stercoravium]